MISGRIRDILSGVGAAKPGVLKQLTQDELYDAASVTLKAGKWGLIGSDQVTPQTKLRCGKGVTGKTNEQIGLLYVKLMDDQATPVEIPGYIRIAILDNEDRIRTNGYIIHSIRNDKLSVDKTDLTTGFKFPVQGIQLRPYDKVALYLKPDSDVVAVKADSDIRVDCTLYA